MSQFFKSDSYTLDSELENKEHEIMEHSPSSIVIEDEIEVLDVTKESIDKELPVDFNKHNDSFDHENHLTEFSDHDSLKESVIQSVNVLDNEWYTFITNEKLCYRQKRM